MLKKLNIVFIILVSFLLYFVKFNDFNEEYGMFLYGPSEVYVRNNENTNRIWITLNFENRIDGQSKKEYLLENISKINRPATIQKEVRPLDNSYLTYITYGYGPLEIIAENLVTTESHENATSYYISNDNLDPNNTHLIEYLDSRYYDFKSADILKVVIQSLENITEEELDLEEEIRVAFTVSDHDINVFLEDVSKYFGISLTMDNLYIESYDDFQITIQHSWYYTALEAPRPILYISMVSLVIILLLDLKNKHSEVVIRKLHGNDSRKIFRKLFLSTILINVSALILTLGVLFVYHMSVSSTLTLRLMDEMLPSITLLLVILLIFMIFFYFVFEFNTTMVALKRSPQHYFTLGASILIKTLCVLILSVSMIESVDEFSDAKRAYDISENDPVMLEKAFFNVSFNGFLDSPDWLNELTFQLVSENDWGIRDMLTHTSLISYSEIIQTYPDSELPEYLRGYNPDIPFIMMNHHSISDYKFIGEDGNEINIDKYRNINWVLAPTTYKDEITGEGIRCFGDCEIVYYQNHLTIGDTQGRFGGNVKDSKLIYVMNQYTDEYRINMGIQTTLVDKGLSDQVKVALDTFQSENKGVHVNIINGQDVYDLNRDYFIQTFVSTGIQLLLILFLISVFVYTYLVIYFNFKGKELFIKYILGSSFEKRYFKIFLVTIVSNILTYVGLVTLSVKNRQTALFDSKWLEQTSIARYMIFVIILESIIVLITIIMFEKKNISTILKGETF